MIRILFSALMGIDWAIKNQTLINFKKCILSFEDLEMWVFVLIEPLEGGCYVELVRGEFHEGYLDNIYHISYTMVDYINPTPNGKLSW